MQQPGSNPRPDQPPPTDTGPIELVPEPTPPSLPGRVTLRPSCDEALDALLADLYLHALRCIRQLGDFHLAVSTSPLGELMLRRLMYDPTLREFPWPRTRVWLVQDRDFGLGDPRTGVTWLRELLLDHSGIPENQLHAPDFSHPDPAAAYAALFREHLGWREKGQDRLDAVMLELDTAGAVGLAPASHPGSLCEPIPDPSIPAAIALTDAFVNAARLISVIPQRPDPREPDGIRRTLAALDRRAATPAPIQAPIRRIRPLLGELSWYLGRDACPLDIPPQTHP